MSMNYKYKDFFKEDILPGGKGDTSTLSNFDPHELEMGMKVEREHTHDDKLAREIAMDHLTEDPHYYSKLSQSGLADELDGGNVSSDEAVVEPTTSKVDKQTVPGTVFPKIEDNPVNKPDMTGCIGQTPDISKDMEASNVDAPARDASPEDHVTGAIGKTPSNPNILSKHGVSSPVSNADFSSMMASFPQDITIDIVENKKIYKKLIKEMASADESFVPAAGDPEKDKAFVKGKRWTVKYKENYEGGEEPIKVGDTVEIVRGKWTGKSGKVLRQDKFYNSFIVDVGEYESADVYPGDLKKVGNQV